jgi:hypothetical protein
MDYAKWDKVKFESSDEEEPAEFPRQRPIGGGGKRAPLFVTLAPGDNGAGLNQVFWGHPSQTLEQMPATFLPWTEDVIGWGIQTGPEEDEMAGMRRVLTTQMIYGPLASGNKPPYPEDQFSQYLRDKWLARHEEYRASEQRKQLRKSDFILKIQLDLLPSDSFPSNKKRPPLHWRRIRVSGSLTLRVLADKVLLPAMGYTRNYHMHTYFGNCVQGAWATIAKCSSIDAMHLSTGRGTWGSLALDDTKYLLCDFVREPAHFMEFVYDLGDSWSHLITVEAIVPPEESNGAVQVIDGYGCWHAKSVSRYCGKQSGPTKGFDSLEFARAKNPKMGSCQI